MLEPEHDVTLIQKNEFLLSNGRIAALRNLLNTCFPDTFQGRTYYKQKPSFRIFADLGGQMVGQVGIDFRAIRVGDALINIFGVVDLCVVPEKKKVGDRFIVDGRG